MLLSHFKLRKIITDFWKGKNHRWLPPITLVPQEDPTTLFTGSGMQQLVPYLLGENHPLGKRLFNIQPCFRAQDINEIGDNRHTTMFEMVGNWSLGDYFKRKQLNWLFELYVEKIGLNPNKLYPTVFLGTNEAPQDNQSIKIWQEIFKKYNIKAEIGKRIFLYQSNWWSRSGSPKQMPPGEPGGPDSELFYLFDQVKHDLRYGKVCHPNCDCGRFLEIGNSVFMEYKKTKEGHLISLKKKNVDFGGGLERILATANQTRDIFNTDLYQKIIRAIEKTSATSYQKEENKPAIRIVADHIKAATFLIEDGVVPANKERGYVLRHLLRRAVVKMRKLKKEKVLKNDFTIIVKAVIDTYRGIYFTDSKNHQYINRVISEEINRFEKTLDLGLKEINKIDTIDGKKAFDLYQTFGFPLEITEEIFQEKGQKINHQQFKEEMAHHQQLSRQTSKGMFKGGLADHSHQTIKYHTATHLLHQALFEVLGKEIRQSGSNITNERLRFDFYSVKKPTSEELKKIETIVNEKITAAIPVHFKILPKKTALELGAKAFFRERYPDMVKVYFIGNYSKEICGGPHVKNTQEIGSIKIIKFKKIGSNLYRIYGQ